MSIDNSKVSNPLEVEYESKFNELSMNERLYACDEYRNEISAYLRALQVKLKIALFSKLSSKLLVPA